MPVTTVPYAIIMPPRSLEEALVRIAWAAIVCVVVLGAYLLVTAIQGRRDKRRGRKEDRHGE